MAGKGIRHRFELSRFEIVGVVVSATAGLFVVFLLGIYAGRGMADRRFDGGEQIVRRPVVSVGEQTPGAEDGLTFYDVLGQDGRVGKAGGRAGGERHAAGAPPEEAPVTVPPQERAPAKPADMAPGARPAEPEPAAGNEKPTKAEAPTRAEPSARVAKEEPVRQAGAPAPSPAVTKDERAPAPPSTARAVVALAPGAAPTPRTPAKGDWSVQVSATRDPRTADSVLQRLRTKGYDAFVLKIRRRGETFYRVRVGHYASLEEAQQVESRHRRETGVP